MTKIVSASPDRLPGGTSPLKYAGLSWLESIVSGIGAISEFNDQDLIIESPGIGFASLFEWVSFVSIADRLLCNPYVRSVVLDVREPNSNLIAPNVYLARKQSNPEQAKNDPDSLYSERIFNLIGFLQSLGTRSVLKHPHSAFLFGGITPEALAFRAFHTNSDFSTVVFGLTRIQSREDSRSFLDEERIRKWRENMGQKYYRSPLFQFSEIWRILSHELALNIWEHSGNAGFLSARVVRPDKGGEIQPFARMSYSKQIQDMFGRKGDLLEICVADSGPGVVATLEESYKATAGVSSKPKASDVLAFAFDELGTRKSVNDSWLTERHALGRILSMVAKYDGALTVRSNGVELSYLGGDQSGFTRIPNHLGFRPNSVRDISPLLEGTHIQILLPLESSMEVSENRPRSILVSALPKSYRVDQTQIRGHLIPLREALNLPRSVTGPGSVRDFRSSCERMSRSVIKRVALPDPIVLDFYGLDLKAAEFETLLYYLQNIIQNRPTLLVQLRRELASETIRLEDDNAATHLSDSESMSEQRFLDTYRTANTPVLGIDSDGRLYLFGMPTPSSRNILLGMIEREASSTIADLSKSDHDALPALLAPNNSSQLFETQSGRWKCAWSLYDLKAQAQRAMQHDFDAVTAASFAWRGRNYSTDHGDGVPEDAPKRLVIGPDQGPKRFSLPWQEEWVWVKEFLEASRILGRGRYADEAAQLLIFRLRSFVESKGGSLEDIGILAGITAPGLLLAFAMHRWWPVEFGLRRPVVLDLGYSMLHSTNANPPPIQKGDSVVIVQDVLSAGLMSGRVIASLRSHGITVTALIALIQLGSSEGTVVTDIADWRSTRGVPHHALVRTTRAGFTSPPIVGAHPLYGEGDSSDFWVEPRTLRPFQYSMLRGASSDVSQFETDSMCLVRSGHYIIGNRHHHIGIDVLGALQGEIGVIIAEWVADLCQGMHDRIQPQWESDRGFKDFKDDVTIVLMPLNSQIHYLWPKVEELLAQRGHRQPMWLLDATLFLGSGPTYRFPLQLTQLLYDTAYDLARRTKQQQNKSGFKALRILVLDDAIATGRTSLTILLALERAIGRALKHYGLSQSERIVEWVRYFAVFNRMNFHNDSLWRSMKTFGAAPEIPFIFEEYAKYIGFPPPDEQTCEQCAELRRIRTQKDQWGALNHESASWLLARERELIPTMMNAKDAAVPDRLASPLEVLPPRISRKGAQPVRYEAHYADTAISLFYNLMYQSYPLADILQSLLVSPHISSRTHEKTEQERYRWAVLEWAIRNWQRVVASGSRAAFFKCARQDIAADSSLLRHLFYSLGTTLGDTSLAFEDNEDADHVLPLEDFVETAIDHLVLCEMAALSRAMPPRRIQKMIHLETALNLFFLSLNQESKLTKNVGAARMMERLLAYTERGMKSLGETQMSLTGQLFTRWTRPTENVASAWTLRILADFLFRGGESDEGAASDHFMLRTSLRHALRNPGDTQNRTLLRGAMSFFIRALEDLRPYMTNEVEKFMGRGNRVLQWLADAESSSKLPAAPGSDIRDCIEALNQHKGIATAFVDVFCPDVTGLCNSLRNQALKDQAASSQKLEFDFTIDRECERSRLLVHKQSLFSALHNWTINPIRAYEGRHKSHIMCSLDRSLGRRWRLQFRIATSFADPERTKRNIRSGHGRDTTEFTLRPFNVEISDWDDPTEAEKSSGYLAACDMWVPLGYEWEAKQ